jgi:hypothetical protein
MWTRRYFRRASGEMNGGAGVHQESRRGLCIRREITTVRKEFPTSCWLVLFYSVGKLFLTFVVFRPDEVLLCLHALQAVAFYVRIRSNFTPSYLALWPLVIVCPCHRLASFLHPLIWRIWPPASLFIDFRNLKKEKSDRERPPCFMMYSLG